MSVTYTRLSDGRRIVRYNDDVPIIVGQIYQLVPELGGNYIRVTAITRRMVSVEGVDHTIAAWSIPNWKFSDVVMPIDTTGGSGSKLLLTTGFYVLLQDNASRILLQAP